MEGFCCYFDVCSSTVWLKFVVKFQVVTPVFLEFPIFWRFPLPGFKFSPFVGFSPFVITSRVSQMFSYLPHPDASNYLPPTSGFMPMCCIFAFQISTCALRRFQWWLVASIMFNHFFPGHQISKLWVSKVMQYWFLAWQQTPTFNLSCTFLFNTK